MTNKRSTPHYIEDAVHNEQLRRADQALPKGDIIGLVMLLAAVAMMFVGMLAMCHASDEAARCALSHGAAKVAK